MKQVFFISIFFTILIVNISFPYLRKKGPKPEIDPKKYRILSFYLQIISNIVLATLLICFFFLFYKI